MTDPENLHGPAIVVAFIVEAVYLSCTVTGEDSEEAFDERFEAWERAVNVLWGVEGL